jgi:hypothetical protein
LLRCGRDGATIRLAARMEPDRAVFSHISNNWAGVPLRTWDTVLAFTRETRTTTRVTA